MLKIVENIKAFISATKSFGKKAGSSITLKDVPVHEVKAIAEQYDVRLHEPTKDMPCTWCIISPENAVITIQSEEQVVIDTKKIIYN